jgi:hypothetical protein
VNLDHNLGLLIQRQYFDGSGQLTGRSESEYGLDFNSIKYRQFDAAQNLELAIHSSYDDKGMIIQEVVYGGLGQLSGSTDFFRDSNGNILRMENKDGAGLLNYYALYTYDTAGRKLGNKIYDNSGMISDTVYSYDASGRPTIKRFDYKLSGVFTETVTFKRVTGWASFFTSLRQGPR